MTTFPAGSIARKQLEMSCVYQACLGGSKLEHNVRLVLAATLDSLFSHECDFRLPRVAARAHASADIKMIYMGAKFQVPTN